MDLVEEALTIVLRTHGALDRADAIEPSVAAELSICMDVAHGIKPRRYGALITAAAPPARVGQLLTGDLEDDELRGVAEGRSLLVCRSGAARAQLLQLRRPLQTDADCEAIAAMTFGVLFRIDPGGRIQVVGPYGTAYLDVGETWTRPHMSAVVKALRSIGPAADPRTLEALATLAYSHLSPARIGATLVSQLVPSDGQSGWFGGVTLEALHLNVRADAHLSGILHQIEHRDGAVVFGRDGALRRAGVILVPSSASVESVGDVRGGTRHHSAAWHSYDRPDVLCFVISKSGRVTVFSHGADVSPRQALGQLVQQSRSG